MSSPKLFYDGCDLTKFASYPNIMGFTTNTTIMRQSNQLNYREFYKANASLIKNRPISFQIFTDDLNEALEQAHAICSIGPNIYVKIPIINSSGESFLPVINQLLAEGVPVNITAIFTKNQLHEIQHHILNTNTPVLVSVFGGRISDTGVNPRDTIAYAVDLFKSNPKIEVLWAGCKDNLVLQTAKDVGCQIVTLPDTVLSRISRLGQSLDSLSQESVRLFLKDAVESGLRIL